MSAEATNDFCYVIAEAGVNHNGDLDLACQLVEQAAKAGADAVKFQTFRAEALASVSAPNADYQKETVPESGSQLELLRTLELPHAAHGKLRDHCKLLGIEFLSSGFDVPSLEFLGGFGMPRFKIPSGEVTNYPYLVKVASFGRPCILSTGMADLDEIRAAIDLLLAKGLETAQVTLLHCTTAYPTPPEEINLRAMNTIAEAFPECGFGLSDHSEGIEIAMGAVALGATVIEKHFTLDRNMEGPDHRASIEPAELAAMVKGIRKVTAALGIPDKTPTATERINMPVARKSIVAATKIAKGETFTESNLTTKRPGSGLSPMRWPEVLGQKASREYSPDELIE